MISPPKNCACREMHTLFLEGNKFLVEGNAEIPGGGGGEC